MPTLGDIVAFLGDGHDVTALHEGWASAEVARPAALGDAGPDSITFARTAKALERLSEAPAMLIVPSGLDVQAAALAERGVKALVACANPRLSFARVAGRFFAPERPVGIHPSAVIDERAVIGERVYIGPAATIGAAELGDGSVIHAGVSIYDGVRLGTGVTVHAGAVLGADGFGYERDVDGTPVKFPQLGGVRVGDDVEIGANACIDRGALHDTVLERAVKIDNNVHIAHNVVVGEGTMIAANAVVAGSTVLGRNVWVGPSACISNGLKIGDDAFVTLGSVVVRDVEPGARVTGNFAVDHERFRRMMRERAE